MTSEIRRIGDCRRWADVVIHSGVARWVEVAAEMSGSTEDQLRQIFTQIDETLQQLGTTRHHLLQVLICLSDLADVPALNAEWDAWVPQGHAPVRACIQAGLQGTCRAELVITAAVPVRGD